MQKQKSEIPQQFPQPREMFSCGKSCEVFRTGVVSFLGIEMRPQNENACEPADGANLDITFDLWFLSVQKLIQLQVMWCVLGFGFFFPSFSPSPVGS